MASALTQDQLNQIAKGSGYQGGSFSSAGLSSTPQVSNQSLGLSTPVQPPAQTAPPTIQQFNQSMVNPPTPTQAAPTPSPYMGNSIVDALNQGGQASDFNSRTKLAQTYGIEGYQGTADQNLALLQKYKSGLQTAQSSGAPAPTTSSAGSQAVSDITGGTTPPPSINPVDTILAQDKAHAQYMQDYKALTDLNAQRTSLVDDYKKMQADANLPALNAESINMKKVIDGTTDDIRAEIQASGGFGTESQVQALASARNKTLIRNYNALQDTINNATQNINTMMGLSQQDKQYAIDTLKTQLGFDQQEIEYADKFTNNAKEGYNAIINSVGYQGLLNSLDPSEVGIVEKTLGFQPGQLQQLASYTQPQSEEDQLNLELKKSQLKTDVLQRQNIQSQINERNNPQPTDDVATLTGKPQNATQSSANGFADRVNEANVIIDKLGSEFTGSLAIGGSLPNFLQSGDRQAYEQAKSNFVTAILRRESGAAISPSEFTTAEKQYFPQAGDKPDTIIQKANSRNTAINNLYRDANVARPVIPGQIIESEGKKYRVASDGETLEPI